MSRSQSHIKDIGSMSRSSEQRSMSLCLVLALAFELFGEKNFVLGTPVFLRNIWFKIEYKDRAVKFMSQY